MKRFFDEELEQLKSHLLLMGQKAVDQVRLALRALVERDPDLANQVRRNDDELDDLEIQIDAEVVSYMSLRAPVARELRLVIVGMKASHELERVGDEANGIAKRVIKLAREQPVQLDREIPRLTEMALEMLRDALDSFLEADDAKAQRVCARDEEIDRIHKEIYRRLTALVSENPASVSAVIELMFVSKSIERIADHATNIAEEVIYLLKGIDIRHERTQRP